MRFICKDWKECGKKKTSHNIKGKLLLYCESSLWKFFALLLNRSSGPFLWTVPSQFLSKKMVLVYYLKITSDTSGSKRDCIDNMFLLAPSVLFDPQKQMLNSLAIHSWTNTWLKTKTQRNCPCHNYTDMDVSWSDHEMDDGCIVKFT